MKSFFKLLLVVVIVTLPLSGCFKSEEEKMAEKAAEEMADAFGDLAKLGADLEGIEDMSEEDLANSFGAMMELGSEMEMKEFDSQKSLDLPSELPRDLVYTSSKVVGVSNSSSSGDVQLYVELRTSDDVDAIKAFYQKALKDNSDWSVDNESMDMGYYELSASQEDGDTYKNVEVTVYYNDFSKLIDIDVDYSEY